MASRLNGFNAVARVYDAMAFLIFGDTIKAAQKYFFDSIPDGADVLIIGGGTGKAVTNLLEQKGECQVWYVEASSAMIARARVHLAKFGDRVTFIHGTEANIPARLYDGVITQFFLDVFSDTECARVAGVIAQTMSPRAVWLASDFVDINTWWSGALLNVMYIFFRITSGVEARRLPPWQATLEGLGFRAAKRKDYCRGFIRSIVYEKPPAPIGR